jgi:O-antigen/teichoic acid export membrane protein
MEKKPSLFMVCLGYGVIIALAIIVLMLILFLLNLDQNKALSALTYIVLIAGIILSQFNYRNKYLNGYIEYGQAFMVGMMTSLVLAIIIGVYSYIFFKYIDPGAMEEMMLQTEQEMLNRGMTDMEIEQGMMVASKFQSVGMFTFFAVLGNFIGGIVISLITSIFVKKENTNFDQPVA